MWKIASLKPLSIILWLEDANIILDQYKPGKGTHNLLPSLIPYPQFLIVVSVDVLYLCI
jgi:hypothetical protein